MTIQLAACESAVNALDTVDINDPSVLPDTVTNAWIGIDLSILGVTENDDVPVDLVSDRIAERKLAAAVHAAHAGGIDFVNFTESFRNRSDSKGRNPQLDGATTAARLAEESTSGVVIELPADGELINAALDIIADQDEGWAGFSIPVDSETDFDALSATFKAARKAGVTVTLKISDESVSPEFAESVAKFADLVRLSHADPHVARGVRFAIRAAAHDAKRDVPVLADLGIVISASLQAAEERAALISDLRGEKLFEDRAHAIGTVYDVADAIETWVGLGAADGIVLLPASLPTDLASVIRGVLPLLKARTSLD